MYTDQVSQYAPFASANRACSGSGTPYTRRCHRAHPISRAHAIASLHIRIQPDPYSGWVVVPEKQNKFDCKTAKVSRFWSFAASQCQRQALNSEYGIARVPGVSLIPTCSIANSLAPVPHSMLCLQDVSTFSATLAAVTMLFWRDPTESGEEGICPHIVVYVST